MSSKGFKSPESSGDDLDAFKSQQSRHGELLADLLALRAGVLSPERTIEVRQLIESDRDAALIWKDIDIFDEIARNENLADQPTSADGNTEPTSASKRPSIEKTGALPGHAKPDIATGELRSKPMKPTGTGRMPLFVVLGAGLTVVLILALIYFNSL